VVQNPQARGRWEKVEDLGVKAARFTVFGGPDGRTEILAISRADRLIHLRNTGRGHWSRKNIAWRAEATGHRRHLLRAALTVKHEGHGEASGLPVWVSATDRLSAVVNGLSHSLEPGTAIEVLTDALGKIDVAFEAESLDGVPSLNFEAEFLGEGMLAVCPAREVQLYIRKPVARQHDSSVPDIYLIPEGTEVWQP
jgi:hypothetical protein